MERARGSSEEHRRARVLGPLLEQQAELRGDRTYVLFESGETWTFAEALTEARRSAHALAAIGVGAGDRVAAWSPTVPASLRAWFGANLLGAVSVHLNTAYRGPVLEAMIAGSRVKVLVAHRGLLERLDEIALPSVETVIVVGGPAAPLANHPGVRVLAESALTSDDDSPVDVVVEAWDTQTILFTSGTTGPSKGVLSSYAHLRECAVAGGTFGHFGGEPLPEDRFYLCFPLFHTTGLATIYAMLIVGGSIVIDAAFSTQTFWSRIRETGCTLTWINMVMANFLMKEPESDRDHDHPLTRLMLGPLTNDSPMFAKRFGVDFYGIFHQTEVSFPLITELNPPIPCAGRLRPGVEARIVDEHDHELPVGEVGELVLRTDDPWTMTHGYDGMPEATVAAWRNGWWHTGDAVRVDEDGVYYFVDRFKDCIRRRGENISSFELEAIVTTHPGVHQAAAIGVPSELSDEDVLVAVVPTDGATIDPAELVEFLIPRMAHFMVPRFVRVVEALPMTLTNKVQRAELRAQGVPPGTFDRDAAGIVVRRERL